MHPKFEFLDDYGHSIMANSDHMESRSEGEAEWDLSRGRRQTESEREGQMIRRRKYSNHHYINNSCVSLRLYAKTE